MASAVADINQTLGQHVVDIAIKNPQLTCRLRVCVVPAGDKSACRWHLKRVPCHAHGVLRTSPRADAVAVFGRVEVWVAAKRFIAAHDLAVDVLCNVLKAVARVNDRSVALADVAFLRAYGCCRRLRDGLVRESPPRTNDREIEGPNRPHHREGLRWRFWSRDDVVGAAILHVYRRISPPSDRIKERRAPKVGIRGDGPPISFRQLEVVARVRRCSTVARLLAVHEVSIEAWRVHTGLPAYGCIVQGEPRPRVPVRKLTAAATRVLPWVSRDDRV